MCAKKHILLIEVNNRDVDDYIADVFFIGTERSKDKVKHVLDEPRYRFMLVGCFRLYLN